MENMSNKNRIHSIINMSVFFLVFMCYTLKFLFPPFYALTDKYFGLFVFVSEGILLLNNFNPFSAIKNKDKEFFVVIALLLVTGLNLVIVKSGYGAYFTPANFILIFYASDKIVFTKKQLKIMAGTYLTMLMFWLVVLYPPYFGAYDALFPLNTNGAATFSVYTFLCAYILIDDLFERYKIFGVLIAILFVRMIRLDIWHRARGALVILTLFSIFYYLVPKSFWKSGRRVAVLMTLATFGSLIFVFSYTLLGKTGFNLFIPVFYKNIFSGREAIWYEFFMHFKDMPLTGVGTNFTIESFQEFNVHNAMYDILAIHGVIVFVGTMYFVYKRMLSFREKYTQNKTCYLAFCIVMAVFFESFIDVDLIWVDYALNLMFLLAVINNYGNDLSDVEVKS